MSDPGQTRKTPGSGRIAITFSEIISALSFAIDLTEHAVPGHALRSCLLGMRIGRVLCMPAKQLEALYEALLLKDIGCSSNASRFNKMVRGDQRPLRTGETLDQTEDPRRPKRHTLEMVREEMLAALPLQPGSGRILHMDIPPRESDQESILLRCERGSSITRKLGLSAAACDAILALEEHWDGSGAPLHLRGASIPLLARIVMVAEHLDACACEHTPAAALAFLREHSGRWFDPELVEIAISLDHTGQLWTQCLPADDFEVARQLVIGLYPRPRNGVGAEEIDRICEAFADVVDAKSPFTYRHSVGVAQVAVSMATKLALPPDRLQVVHRAALLHDLGKLSVPNLILEKAGRLTAAEWQTVVEHPRVTQQILNRIEPFAEIAEIAGAHHEKLDGSGYPNGLCAHQLRIESRIIAVADIYRALTEGRPYRPGVPHAVAVQKLREMTPHQLDVRCVDALDGCCDPTRDAPASTIEQPVPMRKAPVPARIDRIYHARTA